MPGTPSTTEASIGVPRRDAPDPQADILLAMKLYIPRRRPSLVARPRLTERLNEGLTRKLTLISAPAGFGKTTVVSEWVPHSPHCVAWVSLDESDNDPARFWTYVITALQMLQSGLGENAQAMLRAQRQQPQSPFIESFLTVLLNEMVAFPDEFALVLDDYHLINTQAIHEGLTFLLDHLPSQMHLVLSSRADPSLPLARLRARNELAELRADDLRFTPEESALFLNQAMRLNLSADDIAALEVRTEGWIAGLQLAALALQGTLSPQGHDDTSPSKLVSAFTGSQRYILDYLVEEVLRRQPENIQSFLLRTSILDRLSGPLCDAVIGNHPVGTGQADGETMLEHLERANLFIIPLDEERRWYRYHQLFVQVLRHRLRQTQPDCVLELHRRASEWHEQHGLVAEAVQYALAGEDFERAARLMEENASTIWMRGEIATLLGWLEALPGEWVRARPRLCLFHAWVLLLSGQLTGVELRLEDIERALFSAGGQATTKPSGINLAEPFHATQAEVKSMRGQIAAIHSRLARLHNDLPRAIELSCLALEYLPPDDASLRSVISLNLGIAYWQSGDIVAASQVLTEACTIKESAGSALVALGILADLQAQQGHLRQAAKTYQQALDSATGANGRPSPVAAWAYVGMGELMRQWNDLDTAEHYTLTGLELAKQWGNADGLAWAYLHVAQLKEARWDVVGAQDALLEAEQVVRRYDVAPWTAAEVAGYRGRLWISQGNIAGAAHWVQERGLSVSDEISYVRQPEHLALARWLIAQGTANGREAASRTYMASSMHTAASRPSSGRER